MLCVQHNNNDALLRLRYNTKLDDQEREPYWYSSWRDQVIWTQMTKFDDIKNEVQESESKTSAFVYNWILLWC